LYPDGQISIETPEQITMHLAPAGIGSRFLALVLDTVIEVVAYVVIILLAIWVLPAMRGSWVSANWVGAVAIILLFCVYWGYFAAFEALWHGQTPGKRVAGIRVVKESGRPITALEAISRNLMRVIDGPFFYMVGAISIMLSRQNKRLGDYVAGTIVIHDKPTHEVNPDWSFEPSAQAAVFPELAKISEQELMLIETFLHRRLDLDPMVRLNTAMRLAEMIQRKSGLSRMAPQSNEEFLETVARQVRDQGRLRI